MQTQKILESQKSIRQQEWHLRTASQDAVNHLMTNHALDEWQARFLAGRNVTEFILTPSLKEHTPEPYKLHHMKQAAERASHAIGAHETIGIISDYDVDGVTSAAQLSLFLRALNAPYHVRIPHRTKHGYGPHQELMDDLIQHNARLIFALDGGTMSHELWKQYPKTDVIVIDHHHCSQNPLAVHAFVNPKQEKDTSGLSDLCTGGLMFLFIIALNRLLREDGFYRNKKEPDVLALVDLACLATICDMVPLTNFNRVLAQVGLKHMRQKKNLGLTKLAEIAHINCHNITSGDVGFLIGPRLNAAGRMDTADIAYNLLTAQDESHAHAYADELNKLNTDRKNIETDGVEESKEHIKKDNFIIATGNFHEGVVGLLANHLATKHHSLAFALSNRDEKHLTGSVRSKNGVDIGALLQECVAQKLIIKGGGHKAAGGLSLTHEQLADFEAYLTAKLKNYIPPIPHVTIDADIPLHALEGWHRAIMQNFAPWGMGHAAPVVLCRDVIPSEVRIIKDGHLRCALKDGSGCEKRAIAFRAFETPLHDFLHKQQGTAFDVLFSLDENPDFLQIMDCTAQSPDRLEV